MQSHGLFVGGNSGKSPLENECFQNDRNAYRKSLPLSLDRDGGVFSFLRSLENGFMNNMMLPGVVALEDGSVFRGEGFGAEKTVVGEAVFNTSMTGYQEILTDPSYYGQIVTMTASQIGNYGVNATDVESDGPKVRGFVLRELSQIASNWRSEKTLDAYLLEHGVPDRRVRLREKYHQAAMPRFPRRMYLPAAPLYRIHAAKDYGKWKVWLQNPGQQSAIVHAP